MKSISGILTAATAATMLLGAGCAQYRNRENFAKLRTGMTKQQVLEIMGEPESEETFNSPDIWFYQVRTVWADALTTEDECAPVVFKNGVVTGWGNEYYSKLRFDNREK